MDYTARRRGRVLWPRTSKSPGPLDPQQGGHVPLSALPVRPRQRSAARILPERGP